MENNNMNLTCEYCQESFDYHSDNLYYPNINESISGICKKCVKEINSKLFVKLDLEKISNIKKKAKQKYLKKVEKKSTSNIQ